jgi:hypothetical protein
MDEGEALAAMKSQSLHVGSEMVSHHPGDLRQKLPDHQLARLTLGLPHRFAPKRSLA